MQNNEGRLQGAGRGDRYNLNVVKSTRQKEGYQRWGWMWPLQKGMALKIAPLQMAAVLLAYNSYVWSEQVSFDGLGSSELAGVDEDVSVLRADSDNWKPASPEESLLCIRAASMSILTFHSHLWTGYGSDAALSKALPLPLQDRRIKDKFPSSLLYKTVFHYSQPSPGSLLYFLNSLND